VGEWAGRRAFADVLDSARAGDEMAFAELWRWLHPPLMRWLVVVSSTDVDDVASEVWISISRNLGSFEGDEQAFRRWVFTIARRRAIDWARHRNRRPQAVELGDVDIADGRAATAALFESAASLEAALALLQRLTPDQREVLALRVIVGMTVGETAAIVHKSEGAVRILCHRGLRALAHQLDAERLAEGVRP
jgi:RNA polymerase sigma-70 factor (ECF subfamily)